MCSFSFDIISPNCSKPNYFSIRIKTIQEINNENVLENVYIFQVVNTFKNTIKFINRVSIIFLLFHKFCHKKSYEVNRVLYVHQSNKYHILL